jgi:hypothetical protein
MANKRDQPRYTDRRAIMQADPIDEHKVILGALLFFLAMAIFAALGMQP